MEDKNKELQLKEEEAEKVSGGAAIIIGQSQITSGGVKIAADESDQQDEPLMAPQY